MGRADQTTKVKGMFVHPEQVDEVIKRHPQVLKARLVVARKGETHWRDVAPNLRGSTKLRCVSGFLAFLGFVPDIVKAVYDAAHTPEERIGRP